MFNREELETVIRKARLEWNHNRTKPLDTALAEAIEDHYSAHSSGNIQAPQRATE